MAKIRSIRFTLTFQLTIFLFILLTLFAGLVLNRFQEVLYDDTDALLRSKVEGLEDSMNIFWGVYARNTVNDRTFVQAARDWISSNSNSNSTMLSGLIVRIYKTDGTPVATNRKDLDEFKFDRKLLRELRDKKSLAENVALKNFMGFEVRAESLLTYVETRRQDYIIQAALENRKVEDPLYRLQVIIVILLPLFLIAGAFLEWRLIRQSLMSLGTFLEGLQVTGGGPRKRFDPEAFPQTETRNLAVTFNAMMGRIESAFEQQTRVFEDLSHQMKTPLAVMRGELELALKKRRSLTEYREIIVSSLEEVDRMASIVENLLKLARFDTQETRLDLEPVPVMPLLRSLLEQMSKLADTREVNLVLDGEVEGAFQADRFKLEQALLNLLDNAIKYARPKTVVTLGVRRELGFLVLRVHDLGAVIPVDELPQVFERFWRSQSTMREKGYGLGLSIVKALVEMHGGTVTVTSGEEAGTEFLVRLPERT